MPGRTATATAVAASKKRKRRGDDGPEGKAVSKVKRTASAQSENEEDSEDPQARILLLESQILESRRHYNNIAALIGTLREPAGDEHNDMAAAISLCRVFCRLRAAGSMARAKGTSENEAIIIQWLKERYREYTETLLGILRTSDPFRQITVLTLLMRLVKDEATQTKGSEEYAWLSGLFPRLVRALLEASPGEEVREEFVEKFVKEYDDIRFYTCAVMADLSSQDTLENTQAVSSNVLYLLSMLEEVPESKEELEDFYVGAPKKTKHPLYSLTAHKRQVQAAWLGLFRLGLDKEQRKKVLGLVSHAIAPWFLKVELLMDFLTDSYNVGGSTSLLALSGLFYLIQEKNLDYPLFYPKLYSLLDSGILHSKHRSRFFRLLDTFLASSHLPAALVASFMKRLSRLALNAPPAGIVVVIPWVYNLIQRHPTCAFMIHRETRDAETKERLQREGMSDPFDMEEEDPMQTNAIDSSLWELVMLQSHYHPNVATLAKIISEQFTKQSYSLEDFLDHSYASMLDAELGKEVKKPPVIEYEIPKKVLTKHEAESVDEDSLLVTLWDFS
ncbi:MAG: hypothetical protein M1819_004614 [Sarea resinae]|nr:MAG: hypothetical protein M1819_004614 [Sarea resinae]